MNDKTPEEITKARLEELIDKHIEVAATYDKMVDAARARRADPPDSPLTRINPNVYNAAVGFTWMSGLWTAWLFADKHPILAAFSIVFSFTARLRLPPCACGRK